MNAQSGQRVRERRRGGGRCDDAPKGRGRRLKGAGRADGGKLTAARTVVALGAFAAQDLRDRDGVARPLLRRAAVRMIGSRREAVRRLGAAYLRGDPPAPEELPLGSERPPDVVSPPEPRRLPPARSVLESDAEAGESDVDRARPKDDGSHPDDDAPV